jgi:hypothetical protein
MKQRILSIILMMYPLAAPAFDGDMWLVAGDKVRVRKTPTASAAVVTEVNAGLIVRVIEKTAVRDTFLPGDSFGFYWYHCALSDGKKGWIYGKFLYQMNDDSFVTDKSLIGKEFIIERKKYIFGVAVEEANPVSDDEGLTGSEIHGLPFFISENGKTVLLLRSEKVRTFWDTQLKFPYYYKMTNSEGGIQQISSIETAGKSGTITLNFEYSTQDSAGTFIITAKVTGGALLIAGYKQKERREE